MSLELQRPLMIFDFRQSRQRKFLQVGIGTARDLVPEKGGIPLLVST
jgi:hypothetical protein